MSTSSSSAAVAGAPRRRRLPAVLAGLAVTALVLAGGWLFWLERPAEYQATSTLVVLPDSSAAEAASYYDTLSRGQIVATFAELIDLQATDVPATAEGSAAVTVEVVPDTALIEISASASDAATAETAADAVLSQSRPYFSELSVPYEVFVVQSADGTAERSGLTPEALGAALVAVALLAGLAAFLAVRALLPARPSLPPATGRSSAPATADAGVATSAAADHDHRGNGASPEQGRSAAERLPSQPVR